MKVYVIIECVDGQEKINGIYETYDKARRDVEYVLDYAGYDSSEGVPPNYWSFGEDYIRIEEHDVI